MKKSLLRKIIIEEIQKLDEFQEDLGKKAVILAGLPASGKSTFIKSEIQKHIPDFKGFKTSGSDAQVLMLQYNHAKIHYEILLKRIGNEKDKKKIEKELQDFKFKSSFISPRKKNTIIPITADWWIANKDKGLKFYYKTFYKGFYAIYFD